MSNAAFVFGLDRIYRSRGTLSNAVDSSLAHSSRRSHGKEEFQGALTGSCRPDTIGDGNVFYAITMIVNPSLKEEFERG